MIMIRNEEVKPTVSGFSRHQVF